VPPALDAPCRGHEGRGRGVEAACAPIADLEQKVNKENWRQESAPQPPAEGPPDVSHCGARARRTPLGGSPASRSAGLPLPTCSGPGQSHASSTGKILAAPISRCRSGALPQRAARNLCYRSIHG
jgi:hypothetical protein